MGSTSGGDNLGKMVKNCMKLTKSAFLDQNGGGGDIGGQANFLGSGGPPETPPITPNPPTRGNPVYGRLKLKNFGITLNILQLCKNFISSSAFPILMDNLSNFCS